VTSGSDAALGFSPHSGWAAVIGLGGPEAEPRILVRARVEMADAGVPESKQPYHAVEGLRVQDAARRLAAYAKTAETMAYRSIRAIVDEMAQRGYRVRSAGILDSSGRKKSSLASILASHALIHAADGDHFRQALAAATARCRLQVSRIRARDLDSQAANTLGRSVPVLKKAVAELGRQVGPPWGADQKMAALLAWLLVAQVHP